MTMTVDPVFTLVRARFVAGSVVLTELEGPAVAISVLPSASPTALAAFFCAATAAFRL